MDDATRRLVRSRAGDQCEYCRLPQSSALFFQFHIEHIRARQHRGSDTPDNLAPACPDCNAFKGPNLTGVDPVTDDVVPLFHPRQDQWSSHFQWQEVMIVGLTPTGRATVELLRLNDPIRLQMRSELA